MPKSKPINNLCIYRIKQGKEREFKTILKKHWPALSGAGLTTGQKPIIWRGESKKGKVTYIELMQWKDAKAVDTAHGLPEVMAVWEPMDALTEGMEFLDVEQQRV
jgi:hypothetical protein